MISLTYLDFLIKRFGDKDIWIVGSTPLVRLLSISSYDTDVIVEGISQYEINSRLEDLKPGRTSLGGASLRDAKNGYFMDIWADDVQKYIKEVPIPLLRIAYNLYTELTLLGRGFVDALVDRQIEIEGDEPQGRVAAPERFVEAVQSLQERSGFEVGPNLAYWISKQRKNRVAVNL